MGIISGAQSSKSTSKAPDSRPPAKSIAASNPKPTIPQQADLSADDAQGLAHPNNDLALVPKGWNKYANLPEEWKYKDTNSQVVSHTNAKDNPELPLLVDLEISFIQSPATPFLHKHT